MKDLGDGNGISAVQRKIIKADARDQCTRLNASDCNKTNVSESRHANDGLIGSYCQLTAKAARRLSTDKKRKR